MFRKLSCIMLYCFLSGTQPFSGTLTFAEAADGVVAPIAPIIPTPYPFRPTSRNLVPGYNNPYYNQYNPTNAPAVPILTYSNNHGVDGSGTYSFSFTTADGKQAQESGFLKDAYIDNSGEPQGTQVVQGSYSYLSPDGTPIQVTYIADENGFRPSGVHIPADGKAVLPPIVDGKNGRAFDPRFNRYNPFYNNRYHSGQYNNSLLRSFDPRYNYDPAKYNPYYNNYNPYTPFGYNKDLKAETNSDKV